MYVPIVHTLPTPKRRPAKMTGIEDHWMYDGSPLNFCASGSAMHRHYLQMINYCLTVLTVCWKYEWTFTKLRKRRITWTQLYSMYTVCITERDICVLCMTETVSHTLISALSCWQNVTPQGTCGTPFLQNIFLLRKFSIFSPCSRNRQLNNVKVFILMWDYFSVFIWTPWSFLIQNSVLQCFWIWTLSFYSSTGSSWCCIPCK